MNTEDSLAAMAAVNRQFEDAVRDQNFAAIAAVYSEDAMILPPGEAAITGHTGIIGYWEGASASLRVTACRLRTIEMTISGDHAFEVGKAELELDTSVVEAKYVVVWTRASGHWKWHRDIWNMN